MDSKLRELKNRRIEAKKRLGNSRKLLINAKEDLKQLNSQRKITKQKVEQIKKTLQQAKAEFKDIQSKISNIKKP